MEITWTKKRTSRPANQIGNYTLFTAHWTVSPLLIVPPNSKHGFKQKTLVFNFSLSSSIGQRIAAVEAAKMSFAACKTMHCPTGIENCAAGFITHSAADFTPQIHTADVDSDWPATKPLGPIPNLVVSAGNVLEVYLVRVEQASSREAAEVKRGGLMAGISAASLELVCNYRYFSLEKIS